MNKKETKALKDLAYTMQMSYRHINPEELLKEVNKLPNNECVVIKLYYGFLDDCRDIVECATRLDRSPAQVCAILSVAIQMLLKQKNNYYHSDMTFADNSEVEIIELGDLNVRSYNALMRAGKKYISDIENMSLGELFSLPGLTIKDCQNILLSMEEHRKTNK